MAKTKPKGKRGLIAVRRLGRNYKTGNFDKIAEKVAESYERRGVPAAKAERIGEATAGKLYWKKVNVRRRKKRANPKLLAKAMRRK